MARPLYQPAFFRCFKTSHTGSFESAASMEVSKPAFSQNEEPQPVKYASNSVGALV